MPGLPPSASIQIPESSAIEKLFVFLETSLAFLIALSLNVSPSHQLLMILAGVTIYN